MASTVRVKPSPMQMQDLGPAPEAQVARDLVKHGLMVLPVALILGAIGWGTAGVASVAYAYALILVNFAVAAALLGWAARVSPIALMATAFGGFLLRMGLLTAVILAVRHAPWINLPAFAITILATHLGLLFWETKFVSASLAFPGLKPSAEDQ